LGQECNSSLGIGINVNMAIYESRKKSQSFAVDDVGVGCFVRTGRLNAGDELVFDGDCEIIVE
jgi:hypothetical protein